MALLIPATGTQVQMGKIRSAYGLSGPQTSMRALAVGVKNSANYGFETAINWSSGSGQLRLSADFGGRTTPINY